MKEGFRILSIILCSAFFSLICQAKNSAAEYRVRPESGRIIPEPKKVQFLSGTFKIDSELSIMIDEAIYENTFNEISKLRDFIKEQTGVAVRIGKGPLLSKAEKAIYLTRLTKTSPDISGLNTPEIEMACKNREGYYIDISSKRVLLACSEPDGLRFAIDSLSQLLSGRALPCCKIVDYPDFAVRGLHLQGFHPDTEYMIETIKKAATLRFNTLFILINQFNFGMSLKRHPEIRPVAKQGRYIDQLSAKRLIDYAKKLDLEVIPEVKLVSKAHKVFGRAHRDLFLNDKTYDPAKKEVFPILFDIVDEVSDLFACKYMLIGGDEVWGYIGESKRSVPGNRKLKPEQFAYCIGRIYRYLATKGINAMMWADMLLSPEMFPKFKGIVTLNGIHGFDSLIEVIPKDVILIAGHYKTKSEHFPTIDYLHSKGYSTMGATWKDLQTIRNYARYAAGCNTKPIGMLATTWFDFIAKHDIVEQVLICSSEAFWNGSASRGNLKSKIKGFPSLN